MIVSDWESIYLRLLLGATLDAARNGRYEQVLPFVEEIVAWGTQPGVTEAAAEEILEGKPVRKL